MDITNFKDSFELLSMITDDVLTFPKVYKHTLGQKLQNTALDCFHCQFMENRERSPTKKKEYEEDFKNKFSFLRVLIRLCAEKKVLSIKQLARISEVIYRIEDTFNDKE